MLWWTLQQLKSEDANARLHAVQKLGEQGGDRAVAALVAALTDPASPVRWQAALALAKSRDPRAVEPIGARLRDPEKEVREAAARALGQIGDPRAMDALAPALVDAADSVRAQANASLRLLDPHWENSDAIRAAIPSFQDALKDKEYWVRQAAADVLAKVSRRQTAAAPTPPPDLAQPAVQRRQLVLEMFLATLQDFDRELRVAAAEALGRLGQSTVTPALTAGLQDPDLAVRAAVQRALHALRQPAAAPARTPAVGEIAAQ